MDLSSAIITIPVIIMVIVMRVSRTILSNTAGTKVYIFWIVISDGINSAKN